MRKPAPTPSKSTSTACARSSTATRWPSSPSAAWATCSSTVMRDNGSLRGRLLGNLALLLVVLMLASGLSAYWNGREAADTAYDRTLLASARTIAAGLSQRDGSLSADVPYVALDTFA